MIIDACRHSFSTLSTRVLPKQMAELEAALGTALPASEFIRPGMGIKRIAESLGRAEDFRGCYVFVDGTRPFYVGISKKVIERVRQHLRGRTHFEATLAYRMAERGTAKRTRAVNMSDPRFLGTIRTSEEAPCEIASRLCGGVEPTRIVLVRSLCSDGAWHRSVEFVRNPLNR